MKSPCFITQNTLPDSSLQLRWNEWETAFSTNSSTTILNNNNITFNPILNSSVIAEGNGSTPAWPSSIPTTTAFATPISVIPLTPFPSHSIFSTSVTWVWMTAASPSPRPPRTPWGCTTSIRWGQDHTVFPSGTLHRGTRFRGVDWRHEQEWGAAFSGLAECRWPGDKNRMASSLRCPILHDFLYGVIRNLRSRAPGKCVIVECSGTWLVCPRAAVFSEFTEDSIRGRY